MKLIIIPAHHLALGQLQAFLDRDGIDVKIIGSPQFAYIDVPLEQANTPTSIYNVNVPTQNKTKTSKVFLVYYDEIKNEVEKDTDGKDK